MQLSVQRIQLPQHHKFCADHKKDLSPHAIFGFGGDPMTQVVSPIIETIHLNYEAESKHLKKLINY